MSEPSPARPDSQPPGHGAATGLRRSRRRLELYTVSSYDATLVLVLLSAVLAVWARPEPWGWTQPLASVALLAQALAAIVVVHRWLAGSPVRRRVVAGQSAVAALATGGLVLQVEPAALYDRGAGTYFVTMVPLLCLSAVLGLRTPWRRLAPWVVAGGVGVGVALALRGVATIGAVVVAVYGVGAAAAGVALGALTWWMIDILRQLDEARGTAARLAVAEERLRFARDLHDVYGRTLGVIAVKSDLAAELARRGDERAVDQMLAVHQLSQESLASLRDLVSGYREISLATEVAGAESILRSAGARLSVRGLDDATAILAPSARTALAWAVREGITNVIRHSDAREVALHARLGPDVVVVTIANDGVGEEQGPPGNGLRGLRERLAAVAGSVEHECAGGRFVLTVRLPVDR